jgi:Zn-dependent protease with chaperone function
MMLAAVPFALAALLLLTAGRLGRVLPPAVAVRMLTALGLAAAMGIGLVLCLAALLVVGQLPWVAALGDWSAAALHADAGVPSAVGIAAGALACVLLANALRRIARATAELVRAASVGRRLARTAGTTQPGSELPAGIIVVEDAVPDAYAVAGLPGRVIVSTGMLGALQGRERDALVAHERAHLRDRHHVYVQLAELAAAANPLLRPLRTAVRQATERWADESAAAAVGDRSLTARALARAALARSAAVNGRAAASVGLGHSTSLSAAQGQVPERVQRLLEPAPGRGPVAASALIALLAACVLAVGALGIAVHDRIESAESVYTHSLVSSGHDRSRP